MIELQPNTPNGSRTKWTTNPLGVLLITFHIGDEIKHLNEWWEKPVNLDFAFYQPEEMETWLKEADYDWKKLWYVNRIPKWRSRPGEHLCLREN